MTIKNKKNHPVNLRTIILPIIVLVMTSASVFAQTSARQIILDNGMSRDTLWIMLSDTNNLSSTYGRGKWVKFNDVAFSGGGRLDTAYINSGDSLVIVSTEGDTIYFEGGGGSNMANSDQTFTGNRSHDANGYTWEILDINDFIIESTTGLGEILIQRNYIGNEGGLYINDDGPRLFKNLTSKIDLHDNEIQFEQSSGAFQFDGPVPADNTPTKVLALGAGQYLVEKDVSGFATDANVVHKTGDETVAGEKTFNDSLKVNDPILLYNTNLSNRYAITEKSHKNLTGDGYMGHRNIVYDSLAFSAMSEDYGPFAEWIEVSSWNNTINDPFEAGGNLLYDRGFNLDESSPRYNPLRPKYKNSIEQGYYPGSGNTLWVEGHDEVTDTLGRITRPFDWAAAYDGSFAAFSTTADRTSVYQSQDQRDATGDQEWESWTYTTGIHKVNYESRTQIDTQYSGVVLEKYSNLIETPTYRNVITHDSNDRTWFGDSTGIDLQNRLTFRINGYTVPLIKSNNYNIKFDTCLVEFLGENSTNRNFMLSKTGDSDKVLFSYNGDILDIGKYNANESIFRVNQAAPNYAFGIHSDGKIRINMNAGFGGIDFTQFSDGLAGGWMTRDMDQSSYVGNYMDASNDWVFNFTGTERFKLKSNGDIYAAAYPNTRDDGTPTNFIGSDGSGNFTSYPKSDMIAGLVAVSDTSAMLSHYIERQDTASMLSHYIERQDTASMLLHFVERADTASMLSHYIERVDTASMLSHFVERADTASMLTKYLRLPGRSGSQVAYGGTAANEDLTLHGTSHATKTTSYVNLQPSGGLVGIGTATPGCLLDVGTFNTSLYTFRTGSFVMQPYSLNNGFMAENAYWNGSSWTRVSTGAASGFQFIDGQIAFFGIASGSGNFTQAISLRSDYANSGTVVFGNAGATTNLYTNCSMVVRGTGKVGIATSSGDKTLEVNLGTSDAFRLSYNDSNGSAATYKDETISSTGVLTMDAVGSASKFVFSDPFANTATSLTLGAAAATFALTSNVMTITGNGGGNTLTTITGGFSGQILVLKFVDANVTITDDATAAANTINIGAAFTSTANDVISLMFDGTSWFEVSRSIN